MGCFNSKNTIEAAHLPKKGEKQEILPNQQNQVQERIVPKAKYESARMSMNNSKKKIVENEDDLTINPMNFVMEYKKEAIKQNYKIAEKLGAGSFGKVYKVIYLPLDQPRAMKVVSKETLQYQDDDKKFLKEIEVLSQLDHPNILKVFEYYQDSQNYYVITELCQGGELYEQIYQLNHFSEKEASSIMEQIFSAVIYIHSKNIVHRDLKPENILLENNKEKRNFFIKIIDFGTSNYFDKNTHLTLKVGTPYYIAPEVLKKSYNYKCDIWSCGVILYILLTGSPPFNGSDENEIMRNVAKGKYSMDGDEWFNVSDEAKDLTNKLLVYDPEKRLNAEEAWKHPWITSYSKANMGKTNKHLIPINNIKNFTSHKKFQQATIAFLVHQASTSEMMKELRKIFKDFDKNGDGKLSYDEIKEGFKIYFKNEQIADTELNRLIANIDMDRNNYIEYEEFLRVTVNLDLLMTDKNLRLAFDFFDQDKSGKLTHEELKKVLCKDFVGKDNEIIQDIIKEIDLNGDGQIEFDEFKKLMVKVVNSKF
jgi:calcium-dependent protein kinase